MPKQKRKRTGSGIEFRHSPIRAILLGAVSTKAQARTDKASLDDQFTVLRADAETNGWAIHDEIVIPGVSREFRTWSDFCSVAAGMDIHDPSRMIDHWQAKDFDVLMVINASRFARTASMVHEIVDRTYEDAEAYIYTREQKIIPFESRHMFAMLEGHRVSSEIRENVRRTEMGLRKNVELGIFNGNGLPFFHHYTFNEKGEKVLTRGADGKDYYLTVDRNRWQRLINDLYTGFVEENIPTDNLEVWLAEKPRLHLAPDGRRYRRTKFLNEIWKPAFHGVMSYNAGRTRIRWAVSETYAHEVPAGVTINYHGCEPVYVGQQHERMLGELLRRHGEGGKTRPYRAHALSGLMVCGECGSPMIYTWGKGTGGGYYGCARPTHIWFGNDVAPCSQRHWIRQDRAIVFLDRILHRMAEHGEPYIRALFTPTNITPVRSVEFELAQINRRISGYNMRLSDPDLPQAAVRDIYTALGSLTEQRDGLEQTLQSGQVSNRLIEERLEIIQAANLGEKLETLWDEPDVELNHFLHHLLGDLRIVCLEGEAKEIRLVS